MHPLEAPSAVNSQMAPLPSMNPWAVSSTRRNIPFVPAACLICVSSAYCSYNFLFLWLRHFVNSAQRGWMLTLVLLLA